MDIRIPERKKKPGVNYAVTDDGVELPVIDITHPAFALNFTDADIAAMSETFIAWNEKSSGIPAWIQRRVAPLLMRHSILAKGLRAASGSYLPGVATYLFKLGPENLGSGYTHRFDRYVAAALPSLSVRLRLRDMARLLAGGLVGPLEARPQAPLHLINIAGGPSADSLNALLLLRRDEPTLLDGRTIRIHPFDIEASGAAFGARALDALRAPGAPLNGLDIAFVHHRYDWTRAETLRGELAALDRDSAIFAVSSEGGLFEYGSDADVRANLAVLHAATPRDTCVVGSTTSDSQIAQIAFEGSRIRLRPRSNEAFDALAAETSWRVTERIEQPLCRDVKLQKI